MMNSDQIKKVEQELWSAADTLRAESKLTAAEYKDPVLGLILLRFAENRCDETLKTIEKYIPSNPRTGKKEITKVLLNTSNCMLWIEDNVLSLMNSGHSLREIHSKLSLPPEFQQPYLVSVYDDFKFLINSVWRQYGGWYSGTPSELKPPALEEIGKPSFEKGDGDSVLGTFIS